MTPEKQRQEIELANRTDIIELNRLKEKIEQNVKKINNANNEIFELKKEQKFLEFRLESPLPQEETSSLRKRIDQIKQHCDTLAITASHTMKQNNELVVSRNELVERINMRDYILRQSEASLIMTKPKKS